MSEVTLAAFLAARLDDDAKLALAVDEEERKWHVDGGSIFLDHPTNEVVDWIYVDGAAEHIVRHDPARVLADIDAKRRIIDLHNPIKWDRASEDMACRHCDKEWPCPTLRLLALPYADHPAYDEKWRP